MKLGQYKIGKETFIIAEIGSNHNGNYNTAKKLVNEAISCNVDAVKFQVYNTDKKIIKTLPALPHVRKLYKTQYERFKSLELKKWQYFELAGIARKAGLEFFASVCDSDSIEMIKEIVNFYKIPSGEITNIPLLRAVRKENKPVIVSVGASNTAEINMVLRQIPRRNLVLLHCVASYPTPYEQANLKTIPYLIKKYKIPIGYSDHTIGSSACLAAVALGAVVIEKHFTLDKNQPFGDHRLSAEPDEMRGLVKEIRTLENMLGREGKIIATSEENMRRVWRRGLYSDVKIEKHAILNQNMIIPLRPLKGIPAERIDSVIGRRVKRTIRCRQPIYEKDLI